MEPGKIIKSFISKSGKEILLRYPSIDDVGILLKYINTISRENTFITMSGEQESLESETKWLQGILAKMSQKDGVHILALHNKELVGTTQVLRDTEGKKRTAHVGHFGLSVKKEYRSDGIGYELAKTVVDRAHVELQLQIVTLFVYEPNIKARQLYASVGFKEYGILPAGTFYKDTYVDTILMYKQF